MISFGGPTGIYERLHRMVLQESRRLGAASVDVGVLGRLMVASYCFW